jgi:hypothetical protein
MIPQQSGDQPKFKPLSPEKQQQVISLLEDYVHAPNANRDALPDALQLVRYNREIEE